MSNSKQWKDITTNTTYKVHSTYRVEVNNPNKGRSWINEQQLNQIKNGKR